MTSKAGGLPDAVLFDFDGTLIDSAPDIHAAVNELLQTRNLPPVTLEQAKAMIGNGVAKLVERAFAASGSPLAGAELEQAQRDMTPIYNSHLTGLTTLMPGARTALQQLRAAGVKLALVTNKPQAPTREVLEHFHIFEDFGAVIGGDAVTNKKPSPEALYLALERLHADRNNAVMVGDSTTDVEAARNAGLPVIIIRGGYSKVPVEELGADLVLDSLADLPAALQGKQAA
ncbi:MULTISPECIES: phosphoglycolate phosphatase [Mesorhizobium]|uniref:Phosphoglycolate phosphatase n=1 Tax=Mesorhizobium denitrificans TaxID=2294114 RepID=A0A371XC29_9HYPH|nr:MULTISPECIES: phosphoglycolate phosphatase [Mesorhizobium]RFC66785.1 phosphoglycolate phosphatase [Mesorhizobium denitrificans]